MFAFVTAGLVPAREENAMEIQIIPLVCIVVILAAFFSGMKIICKNHDRMRKELDDLWDQNGWARPNKGGDRFDSAHRKD